MSGEPSSILRTLQSASWTLSTPIQLVGFFDASINSIANSTGFQAHLDKPFAPDNLLKVIKLILRR
jgi:hypothetical protein